MPGLVNVEAGGILKAIGELAKDIRTAITGKSPELEAKLVELENQVMLANIEVNKIEAASQDRFVSRWRPFIGWICGFGLAYHFLIQPMVEFALGLASIRVLIPKLDVGTLMTLVLAMLGIGGLRTVEKAKGVQGRH